MNVTALYEGVAAALATSPVDVDADVSVEH